MVSVISFLLLIVVVAMRNRIRTAIAIFEEASKALGATPVLFVTPFTTYIWLSCFIVYWVYFTMYVHLPNSAWRCSDGGGCGGGHLLARALSSTWC